MKDIDQHLVHAMYFSVRNRRACKVCLLSSIDVKRQTLPEINVHAHLFGTLEYQFKGVLKMVVKCKEYEITNAYSFLKLKSLTNGFKKM